MNCKFDKSLLYAYADDTIEPLERIFVEEHLKYCTECKEDLRVINVIEKGLMDMQEQISIPEKLGFISELVAENCIAQLDNEDLLDRMQNIYDRYKHINKIIIASETKCINNPCGQFVGNQINTTVKTLGKPVKKLISTGISKLLKVV
ncbi:MAG: zf-HC2 domain-containing protein [Bacillota bacterium]|nr:zf-HC2 domain-containing protein [Bacillota bacterium]